MTPQIGERPRLQPPSSLSTRERQLFCDVVAGLSPEHLKAEDLPLLTLYVRGLAQCEHAAREIASGSTDKFWLELQGAGLKTVNAMAVRLRTVPRRVRRAISVSPAPGSRRCRCHGKAIRGCARCRAMTATTAASAASKASGSKRAAAALTSVTRLTKLDPPSRRMPRRRTPDRFFIYIGSASFVFINHYALSPTLFSLCFALNAATFFAFSQMTARLTARFGLAPVIRVAVSGFAGVTAILAVLMTLGADSLPLMMGFLFVGYGCLENARVLRRMCGFARTLLQTSIAFWRRSVGA